MQDVLAPGYSNSGFVNVTFTWQGVASTISGVFYFARSPSGIVTLQTTAAIAGATGGALSIYAESAASIIPLWACPRFSPTIYVPMRISGAAVNQPGILVISGAGQVVFYRDLLGTTFPNASCGLDSAFSTSYIGR